MGTQVGSLLVATGLTAVVVNAKWRLFLPRASASYPSRLPNRELVLVTSSSMCSHSSLYGLFKQRSLLPTATPSAINFTMKNRSQKY